MIDPRTLRGQLTLAYATVLLIALVAFAAVTLALVDRTQRATLDDRLGLAARAIGAVVEQRGGRPALDTTDRGQFARIVGTRLNGAVLTAGGRPVVSTVVDVPDAISALVQGGVRKRVETVAIGGDRVRVAVLAVPSGGAPAGAAVVWADLEHVDELDRRLALAFALAIPIVAAFAVVGGGAIAARGLRPLIAMAQVASEIEAHDLSRRLAIPSRDDELGRLVVTFDRMLDRLEAAFERQRRFTSDASHELRAPLSVIRAEADLMLRKPRSPEEYERALHAIAAQADELEALTRDLLAAARAESEAGTSRSADLVAIADAVARRLSPLAGAHDVTIVREDGAVLAGGDAVGGTIVRGDEASLQRAVVCLVHNALKYARARVEISVAGAHEGGRDTVRLVVADDGTGFSAEALDHATERFWRDDPARARDGEMRGTAGGGGTGLGLSIAGAIVEALHGTIHLANGTNGGAVVIVEVPSAASFMSS